MGTGAVGEAASTPWQREVKSVAHLLTERTTERFGALPQRPIESLRWR